MDLSFLKIIFAFMAFSIVILSVLINTIESKLPVSIVQTFRYGKFSSDKKHFLVNYFEVPKYWFKHFYVFAAIWSTLGFILVLLAFIFKGPVPKFVIEFLDIIALKNRQTSYNATATTIAMLCMLIQCWKRFYETHYLSIFSNSKINISHYAIGYIHYFGCIAAILAEAPSPFTTLSVDHLSYFSINDINIQLIAGLIIFLWASQQQYLANVTLVNLRTNKDGKIITYEHKIPTGGLFDKISCPHLFCEGLMYMAIYIMLWGSQTWPYVFFWVLCNQCESAMLNHWWYQSKFKMYPKERYAFIPYIL
ncbi:polyprenol reductase [Sipha flava]|jgi:3-oxo-5-alpha-steroid 4-dehydrogenase 3|uniref:Polyprenal reductase n=1 Tax=Sipha flava TaxID=143950 RepID=A0A2S2R364_9HEMI|nr:polyprenol reductase [Sipha flava]